MLSEEIEKRTQLRLPIQTQSATGPAFILGRTDQIKALGAGQLAGAPDKSEGFTVATSSNGTAIAAVTGHDDRAVVFGTGYILRHLTMARQRLELDAGLKFLLRQKSWFGATNSGIAPKLTPTMPGRSPCGISTSASWRSSAPTWWS